ncbi:MAG: hypothetical protein M3Q30_13650, partial [Actinomycetota bacterium]|nr:hypothetical protein [Actinomycetota bacterium]
KEGVANANGTAEAFWAETRASVDERFATMRADAEQRRAEKDVRRAERHAETAEQDASDAIDLVLYVLDQAECAIVDAVIARADADNLALIG